MVETPTDRTQEYRGIRVAARRVPSNPVTITHTVREAYANMSLEALRGQVIALGAYLGDRHHPLVLQVDALADEKAAAEN